MINFLVSLSVWSTPCPAVAQEVKLEKDVRVVAEEGGPGLCPYFFCSPDPLISCRTIWLPCPEDPPPPKKEEESYEVAKI